MAETQTRVCSFIETMVYDGLRYDILETLQHYGS